MEVLTLAIACHERRPAADDIFAHSCCPQYLLDLLAQVQDPWKKRGRRHALAGGSTADYNYDPVGRLDTVTSGGQTIESDTYDGFDNLTASSQLDTSTGSMDTTTYDYDSLNRVTSETSAAGTSSYSYPGLSSDLAAESDPGGESKTYDYTPGGQQLSQDVTGGSGLAGYG